MVRPTTSQATVALLAGLVLLSIGSTTALATSGSTGEDPVQVGSHDIVIADANVHIQDVHVTGDGVPEKSIDEAAVTVDGETTIDGFTITVDGQPYQVGQINLVFDDVGVTVEDVSTGEAAA